ncbi:GAF and ANTAR domain-containing protein [Kribbella endophytica]
MTEPNLVAVMNTVAETLTYPIKLDEALERITSGAAATVPGIDHVSISLTSHHGQIETLAPTDQVAITLDEIQYAVGEGPCLEAALRDPWVQVDDLAADARWPAYGARAAGEFGIGSQLAFQFRAQPHARGALNLYANKAHAIDMDTRQVGAMFARLAAIALGWSRHDETLSRALGSREQIGQAVGIVMERYKLDPDRAFSFLARTSQTANVKLHDVAAALIAETVNKAQ